MRPPVDRGSWGWKARLVIDKVLNENPGADRETLQKLLFDAYPFGMRIRTDLEKLDAWKESVADWETSR